MTWRHATGLGVGRAIGCCALIAVLASASADPGAAIQSAALTPVEPATRPDGPLAGGQVSRYSLTLGAGRAATIVVAHRNVDVVLRLFDGGTEPAIERPSDGPNGELRLRIDGRQSDRHSVEIAAAYPKSPAGSYTIRIDDVGAATAADRQLSEADRRYSSAARLRSAAAYATALSHAEQALALREQALGREAPEVARALLLVAQLNDDLAKFDAAEGFYLRARAIVDRTPDRHELVRAALLDSQASHQTTLAHFPEAERLVKDGLAIRERVLGPSHFLVAASLGTLADLHHENVNWGEARSVANRALEVAGKAYRSSDLALSDFISRVARAHLASGEFARAEQLYRESLEVREKSAGPDSLAAADSVGALARVAMRANDNVKAEQLHLRSLAMKEKVLGPEHPRVAHDVFNLGLLSYRRRDYGNAVALNLRALGIWEKAFGASHPMIAFPLNNLGLVYWRQHDYTRAEEFFQRSFELSEKLYGTDSLRGTDALGNLGILARETGNYALAEARFKRALATRERHVGLDHPDLALPVESLAILYRERGDYAPAEKMFQRALNLSVSSLGPEHPIVARHLDNVSILNWAMGNLDASLDARLRVAAIEERNLPLNLSVGSERQKLAYFEPMLSTLAKAISFHVQQPLDHTGARDLAVTTLLQRKGRVLDALADSASAFRSRSSPGDRGLLDQLERVTSDLAAAVLSESTRTPLAERQRKTAALAVERERLEIEIHGRSAGYLDPSRPLTLADVQKATPPDAALIEFAVYRAVDPRATVEKRFGSPRYVAYVIRHSGGTGWKDLGAAQEIDRSVETFRSALADPARSDVTRLAVQLHHKLVAPLQPLIADANRLVISPDGPLNLIPFEALRSAEGRYLIEDFGISYVTAGRDLVRMLAPRPAAGRAVVFADPAFGEPSAQSATRTPTTAQGPGRSRRSIVTGEDFSAVYFAPLAGTAAEAERIHALFPEMELLVGARATESALKHLQAPRILHVATHGFFLRDKGSSDDKSSPAGTRALNAEARIENPLLRSGLALAGANLPRTRDDDGILTALEAAQLNLWGTKLVTLSACDTGVGVVRNGEGVFGLRRAFFLAGTESLVMSLWPVSDLITREIMTGYYAGLKKGLGRGAALRQVQLQILRRKGRAHPFYWAGFIQAGEWASLDGRR